MIGDQRLPDDFDWPDLPSQVTLDTGRAPIDLPSVLQPWDVNEIRGLSPFTREVVRARAELATTDAENERDAQSPLSSTEARRILLTLAEDEATRRRVYRPMSTLRETGRDLLTRLGADPTRESGRIPCPGHGGKDRNLAWRLTSDGTALLKCHSHPCTFAQILAAAAV